MGIVQDQILPAAWQHFDADDWAEIDAAFVTNRDSLTGHEAGDGYRPLFRTILINTSAPLDSGAGGAGAQRARSSRARCTSRSSTASVSCAEPV